METYEDIDFTYGEQPTESKWDQLGLNDKRFNEILTYGWQDPGETWTYASATTFTISGDVTSIYEIGDKIRYKQGGAYKYGVITNKSYSSPNTTITISGEAITNATITDNYYSKANSPLGMGGSGVLGYAERTADVNTNTYNSDVDVTGLSVTVTVPAGGRRIKITALLGSVQTDAGTGTYIYAKIKEGATVLNTAVYRVTDSYVRPFFLQYVVAATAGEHTYKVAVQQSASGYLTVNGSATQINHILVEYLGGV